jgi:hypothetical protein
VAETGQPYAFTGNDPLNATDPVGLRWYRSWHKRARHRHHRSSLRRSTPYNGASYTDSVGPATMPVGPMAFTFSASVSIQRDHSDPQVDIDGAGNVTASVSHGAFSASFSFSGALSGAISSHGFSWSGSGVSYTSTQTEDVDPARISESITASFGPADDAPSDGPHVTPNEAIAGTGLIVWWIAAVSSTPSST